MRWFRPEVLDRFFTFLSFLDETNQDYGTETSHKKLLEIETIITKNLLPLFEKEQLPQVEVIASISNAIFTTFPIMVSGFRTTSREISRPQMDLKKRRNSRAPNETINLFCKDMLDLSKSFHDCIKIIENEIKFNNDILIKEKEIQNKQKKLKQKQLAQIENKKKLLIKQSELVQRTQKLKLILNSNVDNILKIAQQRIDDLLILQEEIQYLLKHTDHCEKTLALLLNKSDEEIQTAEFRGEFTALSGIKLDLQKLRRVFSGEKGNIIENEQEAYVRNTRNTIREYYLQQETEKEQGFLAVIEKLEKLSTETQNNNHTDNLADYLLGDAQNLIKEQLSLIKKIQKNSKAKIEDVQIEVKKAQTQKISLDDIKAKIEKLKNPPPPEIKREDSNLSLSEADSNSTSRSNFNGTPTGTPSENLPTYQSITQTQLLPASAESAAQASSPSLFKSAFSVFTKSMVAAASVISVGLSYKGLYLLSEAFGEQMDKAIHADDTGMDHRCVIGAALVLVGVGLCARPLWLSRRKPVEDVEMNINHNEATPRTPLLSGR